MNIIPSGHIEQLTVFCSRCRHLFGRSVIMEKIEEDEKQEEDKYICPQCGLTLNQKLGDVKPGRDSILTAVNDPYLTRKLGIESIKKRIEDKETPADEKLLFDHIANYNKVYKGAGEAIKAISEEEITKQQEREKEDQIDSYDS